MKSKSKITSPKSKPVGITMGDPGGIGPEIIAKALRRIPFKNQGSFCLIGDRDIFKRHIKSWPNHVSLLHCENTSGKGYKMGQIDPGNGAAALNFLHTGINLIKKGHLRALVTAPLSKEAVTPSHPGFHGHTEYLAEAFGIPSVGMLFVSDSLKIIIVTRHLPLCEVPEAITRSAVLETILLVNQALKNLFHIRVPKIGVCGLNPHAGEGGIIGTEEITTIIPAIQDARRKRIQVSGPFAADTLFNPKLGTKFDAVVAMYHDQGLIPLKTISLNQLVNLTIGLPIIRTSPAHGTAFDIVGKNKADPSSMSAAIKLAIDLSA